MKWPAWLAWLQPMRGAGRATLGAQGEAIAARYLRRQGLRILERNTRSAGCEIDIIACEGDTLVFVEVKSRRDDTLGQPEDNVSAGKRRHMARAARRYIADHPERGPYYRFDVVAVLIPAEGAPRITHYRDAFPAQ